MKGIEQPTWPYAANLRELRGPLSAESASRRIGVTRQSWATWEKGGVEPSYENLRAIVEEFRCPPELIGYKPPKGYELVPAAWITDEFRAVREDARRYHEETQTLLHAVLNAVRASNG